MPNASREGRKARKLHLDYVQLLDFLVFSHCFFYLQHSLFKLFENQLSFASSYGALRSFDSNKEFNKEIEKLRGNKFNHYFKKQHETSDILVL